MTKAAGEAGVQGEAEQTAAERPYGPITIAAVAFLIGVALGIQIGPPWLYMTIGGMAAIAAAVAQWRKPDAPAVGADSTPEAATVKRDGDDLPDALFSAPLLLCLIALAAAAASWAAVNTRYTSDHAMTQYVQDEPQLARLTGTVASEPRFSHPDRGPFARFGYRSPTTLFVLAVDSIDVAGQPTVAKGRLLCRIKASDHRVKEGMHIAVEGWMGAFEGPRNPGEYDHRQHLATEGIVGEISLPTRDNWQALSDPSPVSRLMQTRRTIAAAADRSLRLGLEDQPDRLAFLQAILLGNRSAMDEDTSEAFKETGLAHLLAISGAHLGILMMLVWAAARLVLHQPRRAVLVVFAVLLLYLLLVPWKVPIVRAGLMAGLFCVTYLVGRKLRAMDVLGLAAILLLIWRPLDLLSPGFQLSFGVVAGLLLFIRPVSEFFYSYESDEVLTVERAPMRARLYRRGADYLAVNAVAFAISMPLVAYHFSMVTPLGVVMALVALPVVTLVLGAGYLKILVGLVMPSLGLALSGPLEWLSDTLTGLVVHASGWPGSSWALGQGPSIAWTVAAMGLVLALFGGWFVGRRRALAGAAAICAVWLVMIQPGEAGWRQATSLASPPAMRLNMFSVGDGSCYLVRITDGFDPAEPRAGQTRTILFDCGSQQYMDVGASSIVPALRRLGVDRIDTLIVSHADMDHFCGVLDVADHVSIGQVLAPPQLIEEARAEPESSTAHLARGLEARGLALQSASEGWTRQWGPTQATMLWPPADYQPQRANDYSLVLRLERDGQRLMLNGDVQSEAKAMMLARGIDLQAHVTDLPHHGSFVEESPAWLKAVGPQVVLQSTGHARLHHDKWAPVLKGQPIMRFTTPDAGMVELAFDSARGQVRWSAFRSQRQGQTPLPEAFGQPAP